MECLIKKITKVLPGKTMIIILLLASISSCEKFVEVDEVKNRMLAEQVFENQGTADAAIRGLYRGLRDAVPTPIILQNSIYANEILPYSNALSNTFYTFNIQPTNSGLPWNSFYSIIYGANNAVQKLQNSTDIPDVIKRRYIAEAKFMRALCYFYLVNFFGDVPLVLTTDIKTNSTISRTPSASVYTQIINDLKDAKPDLPEDFAHAGGEKIRANKWTATALLARSYLYIKDYTNAEAEAAAVIGSGKFILLSTPTGIFTKNNNEAIFQFANSASEGNLIIENFIYTTAPQYILTPAMLASFEAGDLRRTTWVRTQTYASQPVSIPFKFTTTATNPPEYNTFIRLSEIYLIRAEAKAMRNDFQGCADDVNLIRLRHGGLSVGLAAPANQETAVSMVLHERQVEFFTEGAHRFFDLKRTGRIDAVMSTDKPTYWKSTAALYPIPSTERQRNPNLSQNLGYE